jgi:hypothetical protein
MSRSLESAQHDCPDSHCRILVTVQDTGDANVGGVTIVPEDKESKPTVDGRVEFNELHVGDLTVKATLAGDAKRNYAWAEGTAVKLPINDDARLEVFITRDGPNLFPFRAVKLARPTIKVVRADNAAAVPGIGVEMESGAHKYDFGDTQVTGIAALKVGDRGLIPLTNYAVKLKYKFADEGKYKVVDPGAQNVVAGATNEITVQVHLLAKPKLKVVCEDDNTRVVPDILADLKKDGGRFPYNDTGDTGVAIPAFASGFIAGDYTVEFRLTPAQQKFYRYAGVAPLTVAPGFTGELLIQLRRLGALIVEVYRADGEALTGRVGFHLNTGPSAQRDLATLAPASVEPPNIDHWERKNLDIGDYEVELKDLATIENQGGTKREWKIRPDVTGKILVKVEPPETERQYTTGEKTARASFVLSKYTHAQLIAFNIKPTTKLVSGVKQYIGSNVATTDIASRCEVMIGGITTASGDGGIDAADTTLKLFMAPEFYFRGTEGAYPFADVPKILQNPALKTEIEKAKYKDWLFVLGTAIGYLKHGGGAEPAKYKLRISAVATGNTKVTVVKGDSAVNVCNGILDGSDPYRWTLKQSNTEALVIKSTLLSTTAYELELESATVFNTGNVELIEPEEPENRFKLRIGSVVNRTTLRVVGDLDKANVCSRIVPAPAVVAQAGDPWNMIQRGLKTAIQTSTRVSDTEYELVVADAGQDFLAEPFYLLEPQATEVINVALVKKGGPDPAPQTSLVRKGGLRELLVYKEYVSPIDFITPTPGIRGRDVVIHGEDRVVLPTSGSQGARSQNTNTGSEVNKTGLGGGSVFIVDGITFGLEVCLDHAKGRLHHYNNTNPKRGQPRVQVHLIPSWGMSIGTASAFEAVSCVRDGLTFNVDGARCESVARENDLTYWCEAHPATVAAGPGPCAATCPKQANQEVFGCGNVAHLTLNSTTPCPKCAPLVRPVTSRGYVCSEAHPVRPASGVCGKVCGVALRQMGTALVPAAGPLEVSTGWFGVKTVKYFLAKGSILIYPTKLLPPARTV